jgi:trans-2,3-dihydro-3-hydroxyanthranilate isomerase
LHSGAVARAAADPAAVRAVTSGLTGLAVVSFDPAAGQAHVRMFAPDVGVPEDPATGSAAVALAVFLVDRGVLSADGESAFAVAQGGEVGRPSQLRVRVRAEGGAAVSTSVRGGVVAVARGELVALPSS